MSKELLSGRIDWIRENIKDSAEEEGDTVHVQLELDTNALCDGCFDLVLYLNKSTFPSKWLVHDFEDIENGEGYSAVGCLLEHKMKCDCNRLKYRIRRLLTGRKWRRT